MARPLVVAVVVAVGLHGGLLVRLARGAPRPALASVVAAETVVELTFERLAQEPPPAPQPAQPPETPADQAAPLPAAREPRAVGARPPIEAAVSAAPAPAEAPGVSAFAAPGEGADERGRRAIAGLMQGNAWLLGREPAAPGSAGPAGPRAEDPDRAGKLLRQSLDQANQSKGLGFGGPVASAAHAASLTSTAPVQGGVTFEVITDAAGAVASVRLRDASGGDWSGVAVALRSMLAAKKLRVPEGASGVAVTVRVEAKQQLPSGRDPGSSPVKPQGLGLQFDLADLSNKVTRVVSSRIVSERRL